MKKQRTFVMIKPNAVKAGLIGELIRRYELARLNVVGLKLKQPTIKEMEDFYAEHFSKSFFPELIEFITSGPIVMIVLEGEGAVKVAREINGATNPAEARPGTIRFDFALNISENVVHSSDSIESARREINFFFNEGEIVKNQSHDFRIV